MEKTLSYKRIFEGVVVSDKMDKTIVVLVKKSKAHPIYKKYMVKSKKFKAHDEKNSAKIGDVVQIIECRPISKDKSFRLKEILSKK